MIYLSNQRDPRSVGLFHLLQRRTYVLLVDLTALFLNHVPPDERHNPISEDLVHEPVEGVVQAGPVQRHTRLDEERVLQLLASYLDGTTITELAEQFEVNQTTVQAHLRRQQVHRRPYRKIRPAQRADAIEMYNAGTSMRKIAMRLGVSDDTARRMLIEACVTIRSR